MVYVLYTTDTFSQRLFSGISQEPFAKESDRRETSFPGTSHLSSVMSVDHEKEYQMNDIRLMCHLYDRSSDSELPEMRFMFLPRKGDIVLANNKRTTGDEHFIVEDVEHWSRAEEAPKIMIYVRKVGFDLKQGISKR